HKYCALSTELARALALDGDAPEPATGHGIEVAPRVQRAAVVPEEQITDAPAVLVDELRPLNRREHGAEQPLALLAWQALDVVRHQPVDVERLAAGRRMRARHGMGVGKARLRLHHVLAI